MVDDSFTAAAYPQSAMNIFSILSLPTFSQQDKAWREQMKVIRQELEAATEVATASLEEAKFNQASGAGELAAKRAVARFQDEVKARLEAEQRAALKNLSVWNNKPPATEVTAGASKIDLSGDRLTLSDGTQIDLKSGLKVLGNNIMTLSDGTQIDLNTGLKIYPTNITV
jgi:hypothetical protein